MSAWQPIATAPKDGTRVLGVTRLGDIEVVLFERGDWLAVPGRWARTLTHWRPLPDRPTEPERATPERTA